MKFYTFIAILAAAVLGTASSAHAAAAAATTTLSGEEEAPNLRRIAIDENEKDDRELFNRGKGQDTPLGIAKAPWKGEGPNKEEEGGPLEINLTFEQVPDNDPDTNAAIIKELLTSKVVMIEGESVVLGDVNVEVDDNDENTFHLRFGDISRRSLQVTKGDFLNDLITICKYESNNQRYSKFFDLIFETVEECVFIFGILLAFDQYEKTLGALGFAEPSRSRG